MIIIITIIIILLLKVTLYCYRKNNQTGNVLTQLNALIVFFPSATYESHSALFFYNYWNILINLSSNGADLFFLQPNNDHVTLRSLYGISWTRRSSTLSFKAQSCLFVWFLNALVND